MNRPWVFGLLAGVAALTIIRKATAAAHAVINAEVAAQKLREAWAKNHTTI